MNDQQPSRADARTHTTQPGESVAGIALRQCGSEDEWRNIIALNPEFSEHTACDYFPVGTVLTLPPLPVPQPPAVPADLEGLRRAVLTPRAIVRDKDGMLSHPAVPYLDEDVNYETFFAAFGIESAFVHMENDVDGDTYDLYFESNSPDCSMWTPSAPAGDGWLLLEIYDTEDGPVALFVREKKPESMRERWKREEQEARAAARPESLIKTLSDIIQDQTVAMQSAIIEWQHGKGAEAGLSWIVNTLAGPGHLPDFDAPHGKHAQFWFNANQANPLPACFCGNPSSSLWMGQGFCCDQHYREAKAKYDATHGQGGA
ncbi:hypothetical protein [Burkholderia territorii]|uniref:hypothetical protein n=1 Tax=Burkholderia territorii TaxID=1503055 RepID=UPI00075591EC|nr:hypothetical protein [Burkholderia territorii]KUZ35246.1 hypothetical protein WS52_04600 [Burkholderia territorii]KUZ46413.1 hypothetical protein WS53_27265 [Burkholderia territorii]